MDESDDEYYENLRNTSKTYPNSNIPFVQEGNTKVCNYMDKYEYKKIDKNKVFFADDITLSKKYEEMLMKKMNILDQLLKGLKTDFPQYNFKSE